MYGNSRRLISTISLLAYLFASAPATMSAPWDLWRSQCCAAEKPCLGDPGCCLEKGTTGRGPVCGNECACHRAAAGPATTNSTLASQPLQQHEDDRSCPGCPACPGKCHLCSTGAIPFCFTPTVVMPPLGRLGRVSADTLLHLWQPHPDELIRPPLC